MREILTKRERAYDRERRSLVVEEIDKCICVLSRPKKRCIFRPISLGAASLPNI